MASKRLGKFTERDIQRGADPSLLGKKKLNIVMIPEYLTSQVFYFGQKLLKCVVDYFVYESMS